MRTFLIFAMAVLLIFSAFSCQMPEDRQAERENPTFRAAERAYLSEQWNEAITLYNRFLQLNPNTQIADEAVYYRGRAYLKKGSHQAAAHDFEYARAQGKTSHIRALATIGLAETYFALERYSEAIYLYKTALAKYQSEIPADEALYRIGVGQQRLGNWQEASEAFTTLVKKYPSSDKAKDAARRIRLPGNFYSIQVGAFTNKSNADALASRLQQAGFEPLITTWDIEGQSWYYVRTGRFTKRTDAKVFENRLIAAGFVDTQVYP